MLPYRRAHASPLRNVLIVGAGNGTDVAIALAHGAKHIDAVEIDPRIYQIGRELNPEHPYQRPEVSVHINDGRAFLERTSNRYDLILFALPDSLALVSGQSSLRLESYLFTKEAMAAARRHLNAGGAFGMYNYYRQGWLLDRLARTLELAYGHRPCVDSTVGAGGRFSLLMIGLRAQDAACATTWDPLSRSIPSPATDDHPFLYLQSRSIPQLYLVAIATVLLVRCCWCGERRDRSHKCAVTPTCFSWAPRSCCSRRRMSCSSRSYSARRGSLTHSCSSAFSLPSSLRSNSPNASASLILACCT